MIIYRPCDKDFLKYQCCKVISVSVAIWYVMSVLISPILLKDFIISIKYYDYKTSDKVIYILKYCYKYFAPYLHSMLISTTKLIRTDIAILVGRKQCRPKMKHVKKQIL